MEEYGRRPKFCHINMPLQPMAIAQIAYGGGVIKHRIIALWWH